MQRQPVVLRYFDIAGRAQPLRYALAEANVAFEDLRVSYEGFQQQRSDPEYVGLYQGLPTLTWGGATVAETLPISSFIASRTGEYDGLSDVEVARHQALCSHCYLEVLVRLGELIWADALYPGADLSVAWRAFAARVLQKVECVERQLTGEWLSGARPGVSDFFALESLTAFRYVLGTLRDPALSQRLPRLFDLAQRLIARPNVARTSAARPACFTARPDEASAVDRLRSFDLTGLGL